MLVEEKKRRDEFISFLKNIGIDVNTHTKARGNQGIYFKKRIDVSKKLSTERQIQVMAHEFAHYIHSKIEPDMAITKGTLEKVFCTDDTKGIYEELLELTLQVDENARLKALYNFKDVIIKNISEQEQIIKNEYPNFKRSEKFTEFEKYIRRSKAKYLLKYDRVRYITPFFHNEEIYTIENLEKDFPGMPAAFCAYIRLRSFQKKRKRISARILKYKKYYSSPSELFARFVESFFVDSNLAFKIAPNTCEHFFRLLNSGYYYELKQLFEMPSIYNEGV